MTARRRSARLHDQVLDAALTLFADHGIGDTSMDAIADAAGVSKATVYNHWADKEALCLEALERLHGLNEIPPPFDSGDLQADLTALLKYQPAADRAELQKRILPHLIAYAARNRPFGDTWRSRVMGPPRARIALVLQRAIKAGELPRNLHIELATAMLIGPVLYRNIFVKMHGGLPEDTPEQVVSAFCRAYQLRIRRTGRSVRKPLRRSPNRKSRIPM
jgi:AcrR family transcriptional regulator